MTREQRMPDGLSAPCHSSCRAYLTTTMGFLCLYKRCKLRDPRPLTQQLHKRLRLRAESAAKGDYRVKVLQYWHAVISVSLFGAGDRPTVRYRALLISKSYHCGLGQEADMVV